MTDKITLTNLVNLQNETTAVNAINANNAVLVTALDNTLSRDGTQPNVMSASLDMNNNQIINMPAPSTENSPARLIDVISNPTIVIPGTGTSGHVVPFLDGNNTFSGNNSLTGGNNFVGTVLLENSMTSQGSNTFTGPNSFSNNNTFSVGTSTFSGTTNFTGSVSGNVVTSIAGNVGAMTLTKGITNSGNAIGLALTNASSQVFIGNPTGNASTSGAMMGLGGVCTLTPAYSSRVFVNFRGNLSNSSSGAIASTQLYYGTGTRPTNGQATFGTSVGPFLSATMSGVSAQIPFCAGGIITGLTPGTPYWFDIVLVASTGTSSVFAVTFDGMEF